MKHGHQFDAFQLSVATQRPTIEMDRNTPAMGPVPATTARTRVGGVATMGTVWGAVLAIPTGERLWGRGRRPPLFRRCRWR